MRIASGLAVGSGGAADTPALAADLTRQVRATLTNDSIDLLMVFVAASLAPSFESLIAALRHSLLPAGRGHILAITAESIIGTDQEIERQPAASVLALSFKNADVHIHPFHLHEEDWPDAIGEEGALRQRLGAIDNTRAFIILADPFTTPVVQLLEAWSRQFPEAPVIGGMASGMRAAGDARLALDDGVYSEGAVGVAISGNVEIDCVVSQGCRPVGENLVITRCNRNVIEQLDGKKALAAIEEMISGLPLHDRQLIATGGLLIGRVIDEGKGNYGRGDFLIRSLVGVRRDSGAILIGDMVRTGQTVQFHVRDARTAEQEMRLLLEGETILADPPAGALLITCNARGTRLFEMRHHDISLTRQVLGAIPVAGFFAAGELGPVGDRNFIHGHTAVLALFRSST
ncbi:MAG TPA: FIST N-terminal domain-containing protein [Phycisphaerae bacterium]|nr:FIST N-terminal domain-containing protein [Phycisphaerae bacterium]